MQPPTDRLLRTIVAFLLLWPPLHAVSTAALDVSTWRFGGWGMYATPAPRRSQVLVVGRHCSFRPPLIDRADGARAIVLGSRSFRTGALPLDDAAHELTRDVAALRRERDILALDGRVRALHHIDASVPLAAVVLEPRVRGDVAYARARVFAVSDGTAVRHDLTVSTLSGLDALLPSCGGAS